MIGAVRPSRPAAAAHARSRDRARARAQRARSSRRCRVRRRTTKSCACEAFGLTFPNPVGLAAGFDKHAEVIDRAAAARLRLRRGGRRDAASRSRAIRGRGCSGSMPTRRSSTASASTAMASRRSRSGSRRARARPASSASISAPTRIRSTAPPTMCLHRGARPACRAFSPSTSRRPTRRACATCSRRARSTICSRA